MILYLSVKQRDINILIAAPNGNPKHDEGKKSGEEKEVKKNVLLKKRFSFLSLGVRVKIICASPLSKLTPRLPFSLLNL